MYWGDNSAQIAQIRISRMPSPVQRCSQQTPLRALGWQQTQPRIASSLGDWAAGATRCTIDRRESLIPRITVRAFAELLNLPAYEQVRILHDQKYPRRQPQVFRVPFYQPALHGIREQPWRP